MKNIFKVSVLAGILLFTGSCKKFLDVIPKTQSPQDVLFNSQDGFKDALTGVYIQMKANQIYGKNMTYGTIENLVSSWDVTAGSTAEQIGLFNYEHESVQSSFSSIYLKTYGTIANINAILENIDEYQSVFKNKELYAVIKGEALALRAYLHFDMLRLFGALPTNIDLSVRLPYVTTLSNKQNELIDYNTYLSKVIKDLSEAETLLIDVDPILKYSLTELRSPGPNYVFNPSDEYLAYRYLRMNYYAVKALQARIYLWNGETDAAYTAAKAVIDAKDRNGNPTFRLGVSSDYAASNFILTPEHIFGLYDYSMYTTYVDVFENGELKKGSNFDLVRAQLYGNTGTDIREANLWQVRTMANQSQINIIKKYMVAQNPTLATDFKQIPMLRLSELYLIAAEVGPLAEAQEYWNKFLQARNITTTILDQSITIRQPEIVKEYRKEFFAEGQAFYAYKRINAPRSLIVFAPITVSVDYIVPLPLSERIN